MPLARRHQRPVDRAGAAMSIAPDTDLVIVLEATLSCPHCGHRERLTMPTDACLWFHECAGCHALLRPKEGDCCVFCSYADRPCPPVQAGGAACCSR